MTPEQLEEKLVVGARIRFGQKYCEFTGRLDEVDKVFELVEGHFEYDNGLYTEDQTAPSIIDEDGDDFDSIYHLFGNDLLDFLDCEIVFTPSTNQGEIDERSVATDVK